MLTVRTVLAVIGMASALSAEVAAQSALTGRWQEVTNSGLNAELTLEASKTALTGTFTIRARPMTITDGQVTKNTLTFKAALEGQPEGFSGELKGDELELWRDRNGRTDVITLKRVQAGLVGKWQGQTPNGMSLTLDLTGDDRSFRGTLTREGETAPIADGTTSKNTFTFKVTIEGQTETIEGTWENDQLKAWLTRQGPERTAVLKRVIVK
jgi:hypothetical protein